MKEKSRSSSPVSLGADGSIVINEETLNRRMDEFARDTEFLQSLMPELRKQCPDRWVAVYQEQVVADAPTIKGMMRKLERKGIPRGRVAAAFIRAKPMARVL